jgi:hypothetical protein
LFGSFISLFHTPYILIPELRASSEDICGIRFDVRLLTDRILLLLAYSHRSNYGYSTNLSYFPAGGGVASKKSLIAVVVVFTSIPWASA